MLLRRGREGTMFTGFTRTAPNVVDVSPEPIANDPSPWNGAAHAATPPWSAGAVFDADGAAGAAEAIADNVERVLKGKRDLIELVVVALLAEGHVLLEDVPGVGKTLLAKALTATTGTISRRVQFTADLLPSDVIGSQVLDRATNDFVFRPGPVFANVLLADEINRAPAKTQSALLEAMEERQVTSDNSSYAVPRPFMVIATQNPFEHSGTYALPESQLDRFLFRASVGYPDRATEIAVLEQDGGEWEVSRLRPVVDLEGLRSLIVAAQKVHVSPLIHGYIVDLVHQSRRHPGLRLGASPRASVALMRASRARALTRGRSFVTPDDVLALAEPALGHRLHLTSGATASVHAAAGFVRDILATVPVPVAGRSRR